MADGARIEIFANLASAQEARRAVAAGAEGCGLLRTEFLFHDRTAAPSAPGLAARAAVAAFAADPGATRTPGRLAAAEAGPDSAMRAPAAAPAPEAPPLPPLPDGGLGRTMPSWLRPGTGPEIAGAARSSPAAPAYASPVIHGRSLAEDPTDTTSFISESDLPDWLRQLAATEAAQAEEARRTEEAARIAAEQVAEAAERQAAIAGAAAPASTATQQEAAASAGSAAVAGRWLARRDPTEESGRRTAFADLVHEQAAEQETIAESLTPVAHRSIPDAALASSWAALEATSTATSPSSKPETGDARRWIVIGALLLIIAALLAYLVVSGQFG
jgi:hypothetical protein